jgi:hypothetical protein
VQCDVKGRRFYALVTEHTPRGLAVQPITNGITYRHVTARQVVAHYRRSKQSKEAAT